MSFEDISLYKNKTTWLTDVLRDITHNGFYMTPVMVKSIANSKACQDTIKADYQLGSMMTGFPGLQPIVENARSLFIALVEGVDEIW